jgi:NADH dehydrogenase (ubiquinone) Fe-S protein 4
MGSGVELHRPKDMTEIAVLTGMPSEQKQRTVVIAPRELKTMQSGDGNSYQWTITWKNRQRWSNPLMGWTSTADPMSNVKLTFDSKEDAEAYASKNGWKAEVRGMTAKVSRVLNAVWTIFPCLKTSDPYPS